MEKVSNPVRNIDDRNHQIVSIKKRKRFEEICEEKPSRKKFGIGSGVLVIESNLESKTAKTHEAGWGGHVKNVMKFFGNIGNGTYDEHFGAKKIIPFLERAKPVPGYVVMKAENCYTPLAECLQRKACDTPTMNIVRGDSSKIRSSNKNLIG